MKVVASMMSQGASLYRIEVLYQARQGFISHSMVEVKLTNSSDAEPA